MKVLTVVLRVLAIICAVVSCSAFGGSVTYFHNDISGSPIVATDAAGNVLWKENYRPYGEKINRQPSSGLNKIGFHGKPFDDNTGLSYMGARYYDPSLGRFMGIDPVGVQEENVHSFNRYGYANNNPYKYVDPDGRMPVLVLVPLILKAVDIALTAHDVNQSYKSDGVAGAGREIATAAMLAVVPGAKLVDKAAESVKATKGLADAGRAGKQARLRELANDDKLGSADRGWIKQEMNSIEQGKRSKIRNPPGKDLAHERGREAAKGYDYSHSNLQDRDLHRLQHKYDDFGRANAERPVQKD